MKVLVLMLLLMAFATCACAADWDLARDFSTTTIPNGAWTDGVYLDDGFGYPWYTWEYFQSWEGLTNLAQWGNPASDLGAGAIFYNPSSEDFIVGSQWLQPGGVALFPAFINGAYAPVIRWTAPYDMQVSVDALFTGNQEVTVDVHILLNGDMSNGPVYTGTHLLDANLDGNYGYKDIASNGTVNCAAYNGVISMAAGEYIDFVAGFGANQNIANDLTGINVTISEVPEPGSLLALGSGLLGLVGMVTRRRRA